MCWEAQKYSTAIAKHFAAFAKQGPWSHQRWQGPIQKNPKVFFTPNRKRNKGFHGTQEECMRKGTSREGGVGVPQLPHPELQPAPEAGFRVLTLLIRKNK